LGYGGQFDLEIFAFLVEPGNDTSLLPFHPLQIFRLGPLGQQSFFGFTFFFLENAIDGTKPTGQVVTFQPDFQGQPFVVVLELPDLVVQPLDFRVNGFPLPVKGLQLGLHLLDFTVNIRPGKLLPVWAERILCEKENGEQNDQTGNRHRFPTQPKEQPGE
jgi:hypothetical protein